MRFARFALGLLTLAITACSDSMGLDNGLPLPAPQDEEQWIHPFNHSYNRLVFYSTHHEELPNVTSSDSKIVAVVSKSITVSMPSDCPSPCRRIRHEVEIQVRAWDRLGDVTVTIALKRDKRIKTSYVVHVDPRG